MEPLDKASRAMKKAYAPYSEFQVGCVVVGNSGQEYIGCNIENASYGATICAERIAIGQAIAHGEKKISKIYLINSSKMPVTPCGVCLQVMSEFGKDFEITSASKDQKIVREMHFKDLFPIAFDKKSLPKKTR
ncbi:MAG: cytidine deaminase [Oligoflexia bacterium]|nr:cytidine deaminase [Oligoflexia bacterium]